MDYHSLPTVNLQTVAQATKGSLCSQQTRLPQDRLSTHRVQDPVGTQTAEKVN